MKSEKEIRKEIEDLKALKKRSNWSHSRIYQSLLDLEISKLEWVLSD